jgi:hypothetical protein
VCLLGGVPGHDGLDVGRGNIVIYPAIKGDTVKTLEAKITSLHDMFAVHNDRIVTVQLKLTTGSERPANLHHGVRDRLCKIYWERRSRGNRFSQGIMMTEIWPKKEYEDMDRLSIVTAWMVVNDGSWHMKDALIRREQIRKESEIE